MRTIATIIAALTFVFLVASPAFATPDEEGPRDVGAQIESAEGPRDTITKDTPNGAGVLPQSGNGPRRVGAPIDNGNGPRPTPDKPIAESK